MSARREELAERLQRLGERIDRGLAAAGREDRPVLVVVTKFFPASDVDLLAELGVRHVGENRDQEASEKLAQVTHRAELKAHFVGQLQSNKASSVVRYADVVQSVDRAKLVRALDRAAQATGRTLDVLVQVGLDTGAAAGSGRGGVLPQQALALADLVGESSGLALRGVMAVAPLGAPPRPAFAALREVHRGILVAHPGATWMSAGMSADLEDALAEGATHLRVGSAILGSRPPLG